ncbi:MAG: carboxylase [Alistipes sp.]|jgi:pyruvate/oxaloacetate carboxyltransferase|nr:carboxylase [Alistipes sp.]
MKSLKIRDLTLRDGQQSAFATRMTQAQIDRVLPFYKDAGFYAMEVWGGAVPDSVMRYLGENPWSRLELVHAAVGGVSKLTALSRGRNLFGYQPYPDNIIEGFCRNSIESGLGIMRIFDALNDVDNVASTIKYVKQYGGIADCAVCYTIDPKYPKLSFFDKLKGKKTPAPVFTDEYFLDKVKQMVALGADMITIKDMSGLIPPRRVYDMVTLFKKHVSIPIDFHTHCTPGLGLASVVSAIAAGADIVDTNIWNFAGGPAAPALELIWVFCKKMGIKVEANMEAVAKINKELLGIRAELCDFDAVKITAKAFDPLKDKIPAEIDALFDTAVTAAQQVDEETLVDACHKIESYFGFPPPNELVKAAEVPGGMYTNMVAQLKQLGNEDILPRSMELIPVVRLDSGLPPLVTPTSQIVGAQAVNCAIDEKNGKPLYTTKSVQFVNMVKGEYGKTPVAVDPAFREKITGSPIETNYDTSKHKMQPNPELEQCGGVLLAENEKEVLLLELFPMVARDYLTRTKCALYAADAEKRAAEEAAKAAAKAAAEPVRVKIIPFSTLTVDAPLPGRVLSFMVKPGDKVNEKTDVFVLEAMKMENNIAAEAVGTVKRLLVNVGDTVGAGEPVVELE